MSRMGPQKWWCSVCNDRQVDSSDPTTGKFYVTFGLENPARRRSQNDRWTSVVFCVCCDCDVAEVLHPIAIENVVPKV